MIWLDRCEEVVGKIKNSDYKRFPHSGSERTVSAQTCMIWIASLGLLGFGYNMCARNDYAQIRFLTHEKHFKAKPAKERRC